MREIKNATCVLTALPIPLCLCAASIAAAQEDVFAEPKKTFIDIILSNQNLLLAGFALIATVVFGWLAVYGLHGLRDDWSRLERILHTPTAYLESSVSLELRRLLVGHRTKWILSVVGLILVVLGILTSILLWELDAKVLDETNGLPLPSPIVSHQSAKAAIVFIHGWSGSDTTWKQFPTLASNDNQLSEADVYIANYPTYMMRRNSSVGALAKWLWQDFFLGLLIPKYSEIHVIAHSMGGLIARQLYISESLSRHPQTKDLKIRSLITIASPFQGANIAGLAQALGVSEDLVKDMEPRSHFLKGAAGQWSFLREKPVTYCFTSPQDQIVDHWSATGQCECVFEYPQWSHTDLVKPTNANDARYRNPVRALVKVLNADLDELRKQNYCL
jgi:pimeloyl-ACP methyl ester carboxylesterase